MGLILSQQPLIPCNSSPRGGGLVRFLPILVSMGSTDGVTLRTCSGSNIVESSEMQRPRHVKKMLPRSRRPGLLRHAIFLIRLP